MALPEDSTTPLDQSQIDRTETLKDILEHIGDIKTVLIVLAVFMLIQILLYGGFLILLFQFSRGGQ